MKTVLLVDDMAFMRMSLRVILQEDRFEIVGEAATGEEAVRLYKALKPDVVTMDITMPGMSGIEALKEITAFDPQAKVVVVSALGHETQVRQAILNGAKSFIVKPFRTEHVLETLNKVAGR